MRPCVEKCMVFLFGKIKDIIIKNLVFKPLFVNKSILFSSYFSCFKNEKERVFYRRKTWSCGEIITKNEGNWLRMIIEIICFWGFGKKFGKPKTLKSPILQGKSMILYCFTRIHSPKRCFWERFREGFGAFLGNAERMVYCDKEKLQRAL